MLIKRHFNGTPGTITKIIEWLLLFCVQNEIIIVDSENKIQNLVEGNRCLSKSRAPTLTFSFRWLFFVFQNEASARYRLQTNGEIMTQFGYDCAIIYAYMGSLDFTMSTFTLLSHTLRPMPWCTPPSGVLVHATVHLHAHLYIARYFLFSMSVLISSKVSASHGIPSVILDLHKRCPKKLMSCR